MNNNIFDWDISRSKLIQILTLVKVDKKITLLIKLIIIDLKYVYKN